MASVNTNYGALVALQSLNKTGRELADVQNRINTGLKVTSAKDNGAVFAIAEGQRSRVTSLTAVSDGIDRATSVIDVGLSAGEAIGDILKQLKEKSVAAQASDLSQDQRDALHADFNALRNQIDQIANSATFNGSNLVNGTNLNAGGNALRVLTSDGVGSASTSGAGQFVRGAAADGTVVGSTLDLDSDITSATVAGGTGQGLAAADTIDITVDTTTYTVAIEAGDELGEVIDKINEATNGRVNATWEADEGQIVYTSNEDFTVAVTEGTPGTADAEVVALFEGSGTGASINYVSGGGYQTNGQALASGIPPSLNAELSDVLGGTITAGDNIKFTLYGEDEASGGGDDSVFRVTLEDDDTVADYLNNVSQATGGKVTAQYDSTTGVITYRSEEAFVVAGRNAADGAASGTATVNTFFGGAAGGSTAILAPNANGGSSGGSNQLTLSGFDFRLGAAGQALSGVTSSLDISSAAGASAASSAIDTALVGLNKDLASLGAQSKALSVQKTFLGKLSDSIEAGIGNLVDADLAKESAKLQALQVKQQLGAQALSIANQAPQIVLSFFR